MELEGTRVVAYLSTEGFAELGNLLGIEDRDSGIAAEVTSTDGFGIWLSPAGDQWTRILGAPWKYFRAFQLEFEPEPKVLPELRRRVGF
jgi:hypothetical protein